MKFHSKTLIAVVVLAIAATMTLGALAEFGSGAVTETQDYTTEEMLTYAIQDEYMALAEYRAIIAEYGESNPFSNLIEAEEYHITLLEDLFEAYGYAVPVDDAADRVTLPGSLAEAYEVGAEAETNNIKMYETFLAQDVPADVAAVFSALKDASGNHLTAFERDGYRAGRGNENGDAKANARGARNGTCLNDGDGTRNGGGRTNSDSRGAGRNRDNCPVYSDSVTP